MKIAVVGDAFVDRYWIGDATRLSPEAPIPVVNVVVQKDFEGGAFNVVNNLRALGATANLYAMGPFPVKNRLCVGTYQLARWDENDRVAEIDFKVQPPLEIPAYDAIIISDYGKGGVTDRVIDTVAKLNLPTFIDSKRSPRDFDVVMDPWFFPNQKEYSAHQFDYALQPNVIYKKGPHGIEHHQFGRIVEALPAWADRVVSVTGAGDTTISAYVFASLSGRPALAWANAAASIVVSKPFTATATFEEIEHKLFEVMVKQ